MGARTGFAKAVAAASSWALRCVFHRPAANFPGKAALKVDGRIIEHLMPRVTEGSVVVVGTNGKTTATNMLANALQAAGKTVVCNRTGANLAYGVASALLQTKEAQWAVLESDELWLAHTLPQVKADYVLLLNLFRDQLDRCGEIDRVQKTVVAALKASPESVLVYNADDPQCADIALQVPNPTLAFGLAEDLGLPQNTVADAGMCQRCSGMLGYEFRQYGQLGLYRCSQCGFTRPPLDFAVKDVRLGAEDLAFTLQVGERARRVLGEGCFDAGAPAGSDALAGGAAPAGGEPPAETQLSAPFGGAYMVYNVAAVAAAAVCAGVSPSALQRAVQAYNPRNGRLQRAVVDGRQVLLNLAKNPTGFNQNLKLVTQGAGSRAVGFFINDKEADGHDVSWLWDIDFEELAACNDLTVFAGGIRGNDMQVRLKYAGIQAQVVESAADMFSRLAGLPADARVYVIANYTALPGAKEDVERLEREGASGVGAASEPPAAVAGGAIAASESPAAAAAEPPVVIAHLFPDLLNLYGDGGNVCVLRRRLQWRGIPVRVEEVHYGESVDLSQADLVFMGGGPDREQELASSCLAALRGQLARFVEEDGPLLAICGGYQILGQTWLLGEADIEGLKLVDMRTGRAPGGSLNRLVGNIALKSPLSTLPVVGYENHAGRTYLGPGCNPFGTVVGKSGCGNNEDSHADGVRYRNVVGTYLHGPLLAKNPQVADWLLERALQRRAARTGAAACALRPLDDTAEQDANRAMAQRLHAEGSF